MSYISILIILEKKKLNYSWIAGRKFKSKAALKEKELEIKLQLQKKVGTGGRRTNKEAGDRRREDVARSWRV